MPLLEEIRDLSSIEYRNLSANQFESRSIGDQVLLYGRNDIEERNQRFEVQTYMPGWFTIGDDSGGQAILMKLDGTHDVYLLDYGALGSMEPVKIDESITAWVANGCPLSNIDNAKET